MDSDNTIENPDKPKKHPGSENLKPFLPGVSGNPAGRKAGSMNRKTLYRKYLDMAALKTVNTRLQPALDGCLPADMPKTVAEQIGMVLALEALNGDMQAIKEIMDGAHGKIVEKTESTTTIKQMGKIIAEPVDVQKNGEISQGFELTFDIGADPDNHAESDEIEVQDDA